MSSNQKKSSSINARGVNKNKRWVDHQCKKSEITTQKESNKPQKKTWTSKITKF
jgi:hypothetical protein